jgi:D-alanyl-D-alanine carboxypeptidase/D-alanyl-D-alanine-endopeptidase (penicillin-binding protein 4)
MFRTILTISLVCFTIILSAQENSDDKFINDSSLIHASVSVCVTETETGIVIKDYNSDRSLIPASILKLVTSAAALEKFGPEYTFKTVLGYTGSLNKRSGKLKGDIVIRGGGDPALGSHYYSDHYGDFINTWTEEIRKLGIKNIEGRVIGDDSRYDYQPIPAKWLWEDEGNYYGAGAYGLSAFDNTFEIHFSTSSDSSQPVIREILPEGYNCNLTNFLVAAGTSDEGYIFAAPYSTRGWMAGTIPPDQEDFVLKGSISDPPLFLAQLFEKQLKESGIRVSGNPTTTRLEQNKIPAVFIPASEIISPSLSEIIDTLNHESVNLFAEHLLKELGKQFRNSGSVSAGLEVINEFLQNAGVSTDGMFIEDGSGLSPLNSVNTLEMVRLLNYMAARGKYFTEFKLSLPDAGKNGTLTNYFRDPVFGSNLKAKSGSMTRVRSYAGYFTAASGKKMTFCIIVNNYTGPSGHIIESIEEMLRYIIVNY